MTSLKDKFFGITPTLKEHEVKGMDEPVYIRSLTLGQRGKFGDLAKKYGKDDSLLEDQLSELTLSLIVWAVVDENGKPIFTDDDKERLKEFDGDILVDLQNTILEFTGMTKESRDELEKNLPTTSMESEQS